jgi:outer membrane protein assembly factor BamB
VSDAISQASEAPWPVKSAAPGAPAERRLRLWPGVVIVLVQAAAIIGPGLLGLGPMVQFMAKYFGPMVGAAALVLWWLIASRLYWRDRFLVLGAFAMAGAAAVLLCDEWFRAGLILYVLPVATSAWVAWLLLTPWMSWPARRLGLVALFAATAAGACCVRMDGVDGSFSGEFAWRWSLTAEQRFLAEHKPASGAPDEVIALQPGDWPGFRGAKRDGRLEGVRIGTDWARRPPRLVWRQRVGPGWSSFAVVGHRLYTQEQRDQVESVVCYDADTGQELWAHDDAARFKETVSGAGPRATPTFHEGKIYALGAKGRLNCLDAATGRVVWYRDADQDSGVVWDRKANNDPKTAPPMWGFASSPLIWHGLVTVFTGGPDGRSVVAYDAAKGGPPVWMRGEGQFGYCSPHPATLNGTEQILVATDVGMMALDPAKGDVLWRHDWPTNKMPRCVQPAVVGNASVLLGTGIDKGERCLQVVGGGDSWTDPTVTWESNALKAYFNDRVVHKGHVYGFDGSNMFTCIGLDDGKARWRGGRYGNGQVLLLADQDLLLVLTEKTGEVVLVAADPARHRELGRFRWIEEIEAKEKTPKTWNHPVVAHGKLFVRNGEEAACYELPPESDGTGSPE